MAGQELTTIRVALKALGITYKCKEVRSRILSSKSGSALNRNKSKDGLGERVMSSSLDSMSLRG